MLKQQLNIKLQQKLSPLQIQVIKMLEFPTVELEERIREEMEANPALDEGRDETETEETDFDAGSSVDCDRTAPYDFCKRKIYGRCRKSGWRKTESKRYRSRAQNK